MENARLPYNAFVKDTPSPSPEDEETAISRRRIKIWLSFLLLATPAYVLAAWVILEAGSRFLPVHESHIFLARSILVIVYFILAASACNSTRSRNDAASSNVDFSRVRPVNPLFADEIDLLIASMQGMLKNLEIQRMELIESREKMQELARTTLRSQEAERRHVSRELHDQAGQLLVSLRYTVQSLLTDLSPDPDSPAESTLEEVETLKKRLSTMIVQIDRTLDTIRALSHKMRPALLDVGDINLAMQEYCSEFQRGKKINIHYKGAALPHVTEEVAISLFRFLQESLTNVLKHSYASDVFVRLAAEEGWIKMSVADNGGGEEAGKSEGGIGILGMKERFRLLDGVVETYSDKDGFVISARVPLQKSILSE